MDPSCPCCVCVKLDIPEWLPNKSTTTANSILKAGTKGSKNKVPFFRAIQTTKEEDERSSSLSTTDTEPSSASSEGEETRMISAQRTTSTSPRRMFSSMGSRRNFRISMDGNINEYEEQQTTASSTDHSYSYSSRNRPLHRTISMEDLHQQEQGEDTIDKYGYDVEPSASGQEQQHQHVKPLLRTESMPPRIPGQPRMRRRCSVTKYSLEDTLQKVQQLDEDGTHNQEQQPEQETSLPTIPPSLPLVMQPLTVLLETPAAASTTSRTAPLFSAEPTTTTTTTRRRPAQRRCSITKFNLEDTLLLHRIQQEAVELDADEITLPPSSEIILSPVTGSSSFSSQQQQQEQQVVPPPLSKIDELLFSKDWSVDPSTSNNSHQGGGLLVATPESKRKFKVKNPWGRAA